MFKRALEFLRNIDLTRIGKGILSKWGFIASFFGGLLLKFIEKVVDQKLKDAEDNLGIQEADKKIEEKAEQNLKKINEAKTDEDFDQAIRDSLS